MFDCQVKRIHEYKRQLLNALRIIVEYNRLRKNPNLEVVPRTYFFAGKAAPAYRLAKLIIKFINNLAETIDFDPVTRGRLKIIFLPEYNVSLAEKLIPGERCLQPDFYGGLRGERHEQHEIHDERSAHGRNAGRRDDRDGGRSRRRKPVSVRFDRGTGGRLAGAGITRIGITRMSRKRRRLSILSFPATSIEASLEFSTRCETCS